VRGPAAVCVGPERCAWTRHGVVLTERVDVPHAGLP